MQKSYATFTIEHSLTLTLPTTCDRVLPSKSAFTLFCTSRQPHPQGLLFNDFQDGSSSPFLKSETEIVGEGPHGYIFEVETGTTEGGEEEGLYVEFAVLHGETIYGWLFTI